MAKDPAILFYTSDFLTGVATMGMEHRGMYITLLCLQHQKGRLSESDMLFICGTYVEDVFNKFEKDEHNFFFNKRLEEEAVKRQLYSDSRRKNRTKTYDKDVKNICKTYVGHMENENENENASASAVVSVSERSNERFKKFWKAYPKKEGKGACRKAWAKLKPSECMMDTMIEAVRQQRGSKKWTKSSGQYIPMPLTWLNQSRWEDEIEDKGFEGQDRYLNAMLPPEA